eukprot:TRINITY_DN19738_c0_g2_i3.p1 TRINITY_DN19738_c0_g2~~TRINITY_DN19738_c0_g2_i3.p1  ORF type:complete len:588 (+),score=99.63 TRINITY_DN19738_c0_g2_i3:172-1764(+)
MSIITPVIQHLEISAHLDRETAHCPFGVISVLFFFVKYLIEQPQPQLGTARIFMSLLDALSSGMHPHLLDRSDWLVKDSRIMALRRAILGRIRAPEDEPRQYPLVYVYDKETPEVRELAQGASFCGKGQWGMEVHIHEWLLASQHLTRDPAEADFFFVPAYSICMFEGGFFKMEKLDEMYKQMIAGLPYFSRNQGRDHIFTFGSGLSANVFRSWREVIPESVQLSPETWLFNDVRHDEPCFDTNRDIAVPGYLHRHEILSLTQRARPLAEREHLVVFLGRIDPSRGSHPTSGGVDVRAAIRKLHSEGRVFVAQNLSMPDMHAVMGNAKFCFVPKGKSAWSLRFYEALFANCVPVVLSDYWELPFESFLDIPSFVIKWPMDDVGDRLMEYLASIPDDVLQAYMEASKRLRCWYVFPPLLHELEGGPEKDELYRICPKLQEDNAFVATMRLLGEKARKSRTFRRFFGPGLLERRGEGVATVESVKEAEAEAEAAQEQEGHSEPSDQHEQEHGNADSEAAASEHGTTEDGRAE